MAKQKSAIGDLVRSKYSHPDVQEGILREIASANTEEKILSGELVLPSEYDAERHVTGVAAHEDLLRKSQSGLTGGATYNRNEHAKAEIELSRIREEK